MKIIVKYMAQLKQAAGVGSQEIEVDPGCTITGLLRRLGEHPSIRAMLLDERQEPRRALLVFVGEEQAAPDSSRLLQDGDQLTLLTPMAGG